MKPKVYTDLVYDVGMHKSEDSKFYLRKGFRVVSIEAMPSFCHEAAERFKAEIDSGQFTIVNAAIAEDNAPVKFYVNPTSAWGTIRSDWAERNKRLGSASTDVIEVPGLQFADVLEEHGIPYYLKIDIEGADILCLKSLGTMDARPCHVSIESNKVSWRELLREFDLLESLGYHRFKLVPQHKVSRQRCPSPSLEGKYVRHQFEPGASGLFGEEAPGRYLTRRAALLCYRFIFFRYWLYGDDGVLNKYSQLRIFTKILRKVLGGPGWYDTHASRQHGGQARTNPRSPTVCL